MSGFVILVVLGSALFHAAWNAVIKGGSDKLFETVMKTSGGGLFAACLLPFLPAPDPASWPYLAASAAIHVLYYLCIAYAYRGSDLGYAYTIMRGSSPLFIALVAVFILGEAISPGGWLGVILLSCGILTLVIDCIRRGQFSLPATFIALGNALVIMGYTVVDGSGVRLAGNTVSYICWVFFLNAFPILIIAIILRQGEYFRYLKKRWIYGLFGGGCSFIAYGLSLWAMTRAPIAMVAALRETSVIFGVLLGVIFLKESLTISRLVAVLLVMLGAMSMKVLT